MSTTILIDINIYMNNLFKIHDMVKYFHEDYMNGDLTLSEYRTHIRHFLDKEHYQKEHNISSDMCPKYESVVIRASKLPPELVLI